MRKLLLGMLVLFMLAEVATADRIGPGWSEGAEGGENRESQPKPQDPPRQAVNENTRDYVAVRLARRNGN
jgi:hypothetical protein